MTQMTITFDPRTDLDEVIADLQAMTGGATVVVNNSTTTNSSKSDEPDTSAEDEKKANAAAKRKAVAAKKKEEEAAAAAEAETDKPENSRNDVRAALKEYAALEGKDGAIQILKDHGAASITELAEDQFDKVVAACG